MKTYIKKLTEKDFKTSNWSGGTTTQLFIYPENSNYRSGDFKVRISSATVEQEESNFTMLKGVERFITPLDSILKLTHDGKTFITLKPFEVYEFNGGLTTSSFGRTKDFNLMLANGAKGGLQNFQIPENEKIEIPTIKGLNILFSYNGVFTIQFDGKEITLYPNELLVIKSMVATNILIHSSTTSDILLSTILD